MGRRERLQRLQDLGVNPGITDRSWEDSDHEVLALLFQNQYDRLCDVLLHVRDDVEENQDEIQRATKQIRKNRDWILERESSLETEGTMEIAWYRDWRIRLQVMVVAVAIVEAVMAAVMFTPL